MLPTILSQSDLRRFNLQISDEKVGIDGQEKLRYSKVVVQGLGGIGIAAMSCLLSAGIGEVIVIDDKIITEKMLPSQTLFGIGDVGKLRCIAIREKQLKGFFDNSLKLYSTRLGEDNIDRLIGGSKILIKTSWGPDFHSDILDIVDKRDLCLVGAFGIGWRGVFGAYSKEKKQEFRQLYTGLYMQNKDSFNEDSICFGFVSNFIGSALASMAIKSLLNIDDLAASNFYKVDLLNHQVLKVL